MRRCSGRFGCNRCCGRQLKRWRGRWPRCWRACWKRAWRESCRRCRCRRTGWPRRSGDLCSGDGYSSSDAGSFARQGWFRCGRNELGWCSFQNYSWRHQQAAVAGCDGCRGCLGCRGRLGERRTCWCSRETHTGWCWSDLLLALYKERCQAERIAWQHGDGNERHDNIESLFCARQAAEPMKESLHVSLCVSRPAAHGMSGCLKVDSLCIGGIIY